MGYLVNNVLSALVVDADLDLKGYDILKNKLLITEDKVHVKIWDVSTAVYLQNFSIAGQEVTPQGMFFKPDGTKMYVIGQTGDDVNEYDIGTILS